MVQFAPATLCLTGMPTNPGYLNEPFCDVDRGFSGAFLYSIYWKILASSVYYTTTTVCVACECECVVSLELNRLSMPYRMDGCLKTIGRSFTSNFESSTRQERSLLPTSTSGPLVTPSLAFPSHTAYSVLIYRIKRGWIHMYARSRKPTETKEPDRRNAWAERMASALPRATSKSSGAHLDSSQRVWCTLGYY